MILDCKPAYLQTLQIRVIPRSVVSLLLLLLPAWGHRFFLLTYLGLSVGFLRIKENKGKPTDHREGKQNLGPQGANAAPFTSCLFSYSTT